MRLIEQAPERWKRIAATQPPIAESIVPLRLCGRRDWDALGKEGLTAYAKWRLAFDRIDGRKELHKTDAGLYRVLWARKLLNELGLEQKYRKWAGMDDSELVAHAKKLIEEKGIGGRKELENADLGLYAVLSKRRLLDGLALERKHRDWAGMGNDELVVYAKRYTAEKGIGGRAELVKADSGLYAALRKRELLGEVGFEEKHRDWAGMDREALVAHAKAFITERGIAGRKELEKGDGGLYQTLRNRKLLDAVFSYEESSKHKEALNGVLDALDSFGDEK
ncbi:MAG: hypothetical protein V1861_06480 [Candidatus Micrarchaeota archaeon]